jgi:hypothetical protein
MAQRVTVELEDDPDGSPADETVRFGFDDTEYEIDLIEKNARAFRAQGSHAIVLQVQECGRSLGPQGRLAVTAVERSLRVSQDIPLAPR